VPFYSRLLKLSVGFSFGHIWGAVGISSWHLFLKCAGSCTLIGVWARWHGHRCFEIQSQWRTCCSRPSKHQIASRSCCGGKSQWAQVDFYRHFCRYVFSDSLFLKYLSCLSICQLSAPKPSGTGHRLCSYRAKLQTFDLWERLGEKFVKIRDEWI